VTDREVDRTVWALVAAVVAGDTDGAHELVEAVGDLEVARDLLVGLAAVAAGAIRHRVPREAALEVLRGELLGLADPNR
jgi:hypothetical protein